MMSSTGGERMPTGSEKKMKKTASSTKKQIAKPLNPTNYVVTVGKNTLSPIKSGMCILDNLEGQPDFMTKVILTFSKPLQQLHIDALDNSNEQTQEEDKDADEDAGLWKRTIMDSGKTYEIALAHSDRCVSRLYTIRRGDKAFYDLGLIRLATNMVLQDENDKVLLTKRSQKMRIFAGAWVLPGGHLDLGENLEECVVREIREETGVNIEIRQTDPEDICGEKTIFTFMGREVEIYPYFAYESSIPRVKNGRYLIDQCPIGHLIINFRIKLHVPAEEIPVNIDEGEVQAAIWMHKSDVEKAFSRLEPDRVVEGFNFDLSPRLFQLREFFPYFPNDQLQGMSKSSMLALRYLWLQNLNMFYSEQKGPLNMNRPNL